MVGISSWRLVCWVWFGCARCSRRLVSDLHKGYTSFRGCSSSTLRYSMSTSFHALLDSRKLLMQWQTICCDSSCRLYLTLVSCPLLFWFIRYASLASTVLFLFHTILFFWNRYELPALHAGLITSQSPRASTGPVERGGWINIHNNNIGGGTETTVPSTFMTQPYQVNELGSPMRSAVAAASTSLQSIRSLASIHSLTSLSLAERTPNLLFHGGHNLNDSIDTDGEDDSYSARISGFNSFHHHNWKEWRVRLWHTFHYHGGIKIKCSTPLYNSNSRV